MKLGRRVLIGVLLAGGLALVGYLVLSPGEPVYQGKSVNRWLDNLAESPRRQVMSLTNSRSFNSRASLDARTAARAALAAIGPKAAPYVVRRLKQAESPWRHKYHEAYPTWPAWLTKMLPRPALELAEREGGEAFLDIGSPVEPQLVALLEDHSMVVRTAAAFALGSLNHYDKTDIRNAIPGLTKGLSDGDPELRFMSATALGYIGPDAASAVSPLARCLNDPDKGRAPGSTMYVRAAMARALGKIGPKSKEALPILRGYLSDPDVYLRVVSAVAVWRIDGDVTNTLPVLEDGLRKVNSGSTWEVQEGIDEINRREKAPAAQAGVR